MKIDLKNLKNLSPNVKLALVCVGGLLLLWFLRTASEKRGGSTNEKLKERSVFDVAETITEDNKVERSPIEDEGARKALDESRHSAEPAKEKKSLWDEAEVGKDLSPSSAAQQDKPVSAGSIQSPEVPRQASESSASTLNQSLPSSEAQKPQESGMKKVRSEPKIEYYESAREARASTRPYEPPQQIAAAPVSRPSGAKSSMSDLMDMSSGSTTKVSGRDTMSDGAILQEGSSYLGVIEDPIRAVEGEPQNVTITMIGKLSANTVAAPFKMTGIATLNKDKTRVRIEVKRCVDSRPSSRAVDCFGTIGDIEGWDGVGGKVNSPGVWGTLIRTAGIFGSQMALSKMTSSVTQSGVLLGETQSNRVLQSLSQAFEKLSEDLADKIESGGTNIVVTGQSIVRVRITKDSPLW